MSPAPKNPWVYLSIALAVALGASLAYNLSARSDGPALSPEEVGNRSIRYINEQILPQGLSATLLGVNDSGSGVYTVKFSVSGQTFDAYVTRDGRYLFSSAKDMSSPKAERKEEKGPEVGQAAVKGPAGAKITIIEYSSFTCPYCNRVRPTLQQLLDNYPVRLAYKHFDRGGIDSIAAQAAECAGEQGRFWEMHDAIFERGAGGDLKQYALEMGLKGQEFNSCLDSGRYAQRVKDDTQEALSYGVDATPTFFVNGRKVVGALPYSSFQGIIEEELEG